MITLLSNRYGFILRLFGRNFVVSCGPKKGIHEYARYPLKKAVASMKKCLELNRVVYPPNIADKLDYGVRPTKVIGCKDA